MWFAVLFLTTSAVCLLLLLQMWRWYREAKALRARELASLEEAARKCREEYARALERLADINKTVAIYSCGRETTWPQMDKS